jgi:transposase-like protein
VPDRARVLAYADRHGAKAAGEQYGISAGTIRSWRSRARQRAARQRAAVGALEPTPAERYAAEARRIVAWAEAGVCLTCGGAGFLQVSGRQAEARAPAAAGFRYSRRITCPDCGAPRTGAVVVGTNLAIAARAARADLDAVRELERRDKGEMRWHD